MSRRVRIPDFEREVTIFWGGFPQSPTRMKSRAKALTLIIKNKFDGISSSKTSGSVNDAKLLNINTMFLITLRLAVNHPISTKTGYTTGFTIFSIAEVVTFYCLGNRDRT